MTHDPAIAAQAERVIEIRDGEIISNPPARSGRAAAKVERTPADGGWQQLTSGFREAFSMAWLAMAANKMRTLLTMLGIIIGIASVVSIVVVGDAAKQLVLEDIRSIGTNTIDIYPGTDFGDDDPQYQQIRRSGSHPETTLGAFSNACVVEQFTGALWQQRRGGQRQRRQRTVF